MAIRALFFFDPGVSTGVAWATVDTKAQTAGQALKERTFAGSATINRLTPSGTTADDLANTTRELWKLWSRFKKQAVEQHLLDPSWVTLGAENFILTPGSHAPGIEGIWPAYVIGSFEGYRRGLYDAYRPRDKRHITPLLLQPASKGMKFNNKHHLTIWDCWIKGKEHERAAYAHLGAALMDQMSKNPTRPSRPG